MKQTLFYVFLCSFLYSSGVKAQREADNWIYGHQAGLTFKNQISSPTYESRLHQLEGSAVISDRQTGQLLFYTNGISIWNRKHEMMANGTGLSGSSTSTQSALIIPAPGQPNQYYVFTVKAYNDGADPGLHYSLVDMNLNQGLGDVIAGTKNKLIESQTTEKLTAIPHANGQDYWILAHAWDSDEFMISLLTARGPAAVKRIVIGTRHQASTRVSNSEAMGYLKASPDGTRVASAVYGLNRPFELYDFDAQTGTLSNYRSLGNYSHQYGVSFSPDNTKLYLSGLYSHHGSYQFDLATPTPEVTKLILSDTLRGKPIQTHLSGALQLGVDGKLYSAGRSPVRSRPTKGYMAVIDKPNEKGEACEVGYRAMAYQGKAPLLGLPNFIQSIFNQPKLTLTKTIPDLVNVYPNPVTSNLLTIAPLQVDQPLEGFCVYDLTGKEIVRSNKPIPAPFILDTTHWQSGGVYQVVIFYKGQSITKRIVKY